MIHNATVFINKIMKNFFSPIKVFVIFLVLIFSEVDVQSNYLNKGIIPDALINFVALLGWHPKHTKEIFSISELEKEFSIKRIQKSGSVFDVEKLEWMNSQYLMNMNLIEIAKLAKPFFSMMGIDISDNKK